MHRNSREDKSLGQTIVAFLTARGEDYSQIAGFEAGADDYILKPVKPRVLVSRVQALLRRKKSASYVGGDYDGTGLMIDPERYVVIHEGKEMSLPKKEFELLSLLGFPARSGLQPRKHPRKCVGHRCGGGRPHHRRAHPQASGKARASIISRPSRASGTNSWADGGSKSALRLNSSRHCRGLADFVGRGRGPAWANNVGGQWWLPPLSGLVVGAVCYMLVYRQLGVYIQDRVRIIYKTIRRFKGSSSNLNLDMNNDIVEQVNRDVMSWAESQIDEITNLRETDTFRKEFIGNLAHELKTPIFNIQGLHPHPAGRRHGGP